MFDSANLFASVPVTVFDVIRDVYSIFSEHWRPLVVLTGYSFVAYVGTFFALLIATFVIGAEEVALLKQAGQMMNQHNGYGGYVRYLVDSSTGIFGTSRFLDYYSYYGDDGAGSYTYYANPKINWGIFALTSIFIYIIWILAISFVGSVFVGAIVHAIAEVYAGNVPVVQNSLQRGWAQKWTVFGYQFIVGVSSFVLFMVAFVLPVVWDVRHVYYEADGDPDEMNPFEFVSVVLLAGTVFVVGITIISSLLVAAVPSIICEQKSTMEAFKRSYQLCKNYICFIIGSYFTYQLTLVGITIIFNLVLSILPGAISVIGHLLVNVITTTLGPM